MKKLIYFLTFLLITNCSLVIDNCLSQWVYQALPSYYEVIDVKFFDANTGLIVLGLSTQGMLKTTNGGNNWNMVHPSSYFYQLEKIDSSTIYSIGYIGGQYWLYRTFNNALTWDSVLLPCTYRGFSFANKDTGWISGANELFQDAIFRTTNGGVTLTQMTIATGWGNLFFLKNKINGEYIGWHYSYIADDKLWKTTNSGMNWFQVTRPPALFLGQFEFYNENTGWFTGSSTGGGMYKSTNGGFNWSLQTLPSGPNFNREINGFKIINADTLYGVGGYRIINSHINALVWKTTNGGSNWGYQDIDTSFHIGVLGSLDFINGNTGWAYQGHGIHTTNGGGPITFTAIHNSNEIIPNKYSLSQNFPNPFNQLTVINYQLTISANIKLIIYDITGKEINTLINERKTRGSYSVKFDAGNLSSGIYFYSLFIDNQRIDTKKMLLIK